MSVALPLVAALVVILAGGLALATALKRQTARRREDFEELAARRSWQLNFNRESLGRPAVTRFQPRSGAKWLVESRARPGEPKGAEGQATEFSARDPHWSDGLFIMAPPMAPELAALAGLITGPLEGEIAEKLLTRLVGPSLATEAKGLRLQEGPEGVTILASTALGHRFETAPMARALLGWEPVARGERGQPVLIIGRDGMRLRLRRSLGRASDMERFIDLSLELARLGA
ncbi:hypothetical protein [Pseudoroseicyclus sp. CXY001]|uniref:hypothetical protein n=1 Tax=Pseudoroseicyclus sp. CXY001 TaxID=3242492 RepID=UPI00358DAF00